MARSRAGRAGLPPALAVIPRDVVDERELRSMVRGVQHPSPEEALVAHRRARLNVFGRQLLVTRIELDGWPVAKAAEAQGVSRTDGPQVGDAGIGPRAGPGLEDRSSSRPHRSPRLTPPDDGRGDPARRGSSDARARTASARSSVIPARPSMPSSPGPGTAGCGTPTGCRACPVRYVHDHPGALVHQDHKKLGRIPIGGGHRVLGREHGIRSPPAGLGYDHLEVVVDDAQPARLRRPRPRRERHAARPGPCSTPRSGSPGGASASSAS